MEQIIELIIELVLFLCVVSAYCLGLKHGKQLGNNQIPQMNLNPVKTIVEAIENKKEEDTAKEALTDIMEYSRESALAAIKKER